MASFLGALGFIFIFQAIEACFSKLARAPPDNRKHSSKSLVKRSCVGLAGAWGQETEPQRGVHVVLRPRLLSLRIQLASQTSFFTRRASTTICFYVVPCCPSLSSTTRGSPRPDHTKMLFEITCQKVLRDSCGTEAHKDHGSVAGLRGRSPLLDPATEPLKEVVLGRRGACWFVFGHYRNVLKERAHFDS